MWRHPGIRAANSNKTVLNYNRQLFAFALVCIVIMILRDTGFPHSLTLVFVAGVVVVAAAADVVATGSFVSCSSTVLCTVVRFCCARSFAFSRDGGEQHTFIYIYIYIYTQYKRDSKKSERPVLLLSRVNNAKCSFVYFYTSI